MATKRLNIPTKQTGDLLTATEFNATMQGVNDNYDDILALQRANENQGKVVESVRREQNTQKSTIKSLTQYYADVSAAIDQLYKAIQGGAEVDVSHLKPIVITANDTPANGGIDPFSTGGAYKHLVKTVKVVRGGNGTLSLQLLNEGGGVISDNDFEVKDGVTPIFLGGETGLMGLLKPTTKSRLKKNSMRLMKPHESKQRHSVLLMRKHERQTRMPVSAMRMSERNFLTSTVIFSITRTSCLITATGESGIMTSKNTKTPVFLLVVALCGLLSNDTATNSSSTTMEPQPQNVLRSMATNFTLNFNHFEIWQNREYQ